MNSKYLGKKSLYSIIMFTLLSLTAFAQTEDIVHGNLIQFNDNGAWCWYQDERAVVDTTGGKLIIGSDASNNGVGGAPRDGDVEAVIFDLQSMTRLQKTILREGDPSVFYCDDHDAPAFLVGPDGRYISFYAAHRLETSSYYRIYDAGTWGSEVEFDWNTERPGGVNYNTTYSNLFYLSSQGRMFNFVRGHNDGSPNFMYSNDSGDTWAYGGQLSNTITGSAGYGRGYYKYWGNGVDRIDFITTETHPRNYNTSIYHGYVQGGKTYDSYGNEVDDDIYDSSSLPIIEDDFTTVFAANTVLNTYTMTHCWDEDVQRYEDGTIAAIISARTGGTSSDPDHCFIYCRFDGSNWTPTYLVKAGKKMYSSEEDYVGLGALDPNDPNTIYISTPYDPTDDATPLGVREIFKGVTSDSGATWTWTPITQNSVRDNFRPIVPKWNEDNTALLWWRGTYVSAQNFDAAIVGVIESSSDTTVLMNYVDATASNTFLADGSPLGATGPSSGAGAADDLWHWRTTYGNGDTILTSAESDGEDAPVIKTQTIAIEAGTYNVWVNFWGDTDDDWRIEAGLSSDNMQIFRQMACKQVDDSAHTTTLKLAEAGNIYLYQAYLGRVELEAGDTLEVFVDDEAIFIGTENTPVGDISRTWYDGISYARAGDISGVCFPDNEELPFGFDLKQNYPNPFSSITNISYTLSKTAYVNLSVFNILGQNVATLVDGEMSAGTQKTTWNAQKVPAGIYFLKMTVGNNSITKKALVAK
jgi:hypothetical protein